MKHKKYLRKHSADGTHHQPPVPLVRLNAAENDAASSSSGHSSAAVAATTSFLPTLCNAWQDPDGDRGGGTATALFHREETKEEEEKQEDNYNNLKTENQSKELQEVLGKTHNQLHLNVIQR